jgi:hypothetical protein
MLLENIDYLYYALSLPPPIHDSVEFFMKVTTVSSFILWVHISMTHCWIIEITQGVIYTYTYMETHAMLLGNFFITNLI